VLAAAAAGVCALVGPASRAHAEPTTAPPGADTAVVVANDDSDEGYRAFPLVVPHERHYFRGGAEVGGVLAVGFVNYLLFTAAAGGLVRQGDQKWALRYDWPELRAKLVGTGYELDVNNYSTNYVWHPFAGTNYFHVARSSHLSFIESAVFATLGSSIWEFFGEIREKVSVNDMIVTPVAGTAIGETTMQLSGFFTRSRHDKIHNKVLAVVFSPVKAVNDIFDGGVPRRAPEEETDPVFGFPTGATEPSHRFEVYGVAGVTSQSASAAGPAASYVDQGFGLDLSVINLPGYTKPTLVGPSASLHAFEDGNVSTLHFNVTMSRSEVRDALFSTRVVPLGFYYRSPTIDAAGRQTISQRRAYLGMRFGFEYGSHDYDRDRARVMDFVGIASPIGVAAEHTYEPKAGIHVRSGVDLYGGIAAVAPYALTDWLADPRRTAEGLPTTTKLVQYYHAYSVTTASRLELKLGPALLRGSVRLDVFRPIEGLDASPDTRDRTIELRDQRVNAKVGAAWEPSFAPLRFALDLERGSRIGEIGDVHADRSETRAALTLGALF